MKPLLGGKGANLAEMTGLGIPVPPGFIITTEACVHYSPTAGTPRVSTDEIEAAPPGAREAHRQDVRRSGQDPLLLSVRSGAVFSMPGMMDTVLNLGLNDQTVEGLAEATGNPRFAYDSYRRFIQHVRRRGHGGRLAEVRGRADGQEARSAGRPRHRPLRRRPQGPHRPLQEDPAQGDRRRVPHRPASSSSIWPSRPSSSSWDNHRAKVYRKHARHPRRSGHGRQRAEHGLRQQGRDLGHRRGLHPRPLHGREHVLRRVPDERPGRGRRRRRAPSRARWTRCARSCPRCSTNSTTSATSSRATTATCRTSSSPSRTASSSCCRPATASARRRPRCRMAVDMVAEGLITKEEAVQRIDPGQLDQLLHPRARHQGQVRRARHRAERLARAPPSARWSSTPTRRGARARPASRSSSCGGRPTPTTSTA